MLIATESGSFVEMSGDFSDWTLSDVQWYFERCGYEFFIDGDRQTILAI